MALSNNWLWKQGKKLGFNIERTAETNLAFDASAIASAKAVGATHIRDFLPWTTNGNFGLPGYPALPSDAVINSYLDGIQRVLDAGMDSAFDCCDVLSGNDLSGQGYINAKTHVGNVARLFALRNFPKSRVIIGSTNEWGGSTNAVVMPLVAELALLIQSICGKDQPITINGAYWDYNAEEISTDFYVPAGLMCPIVQTHDYDFQSTAAWNALAAKLAALETRLGCPVYMGEVGLAGGSAAYNQGEYEGTLVSLMGAMAEYAPTIWALTQGSADRLNNSATDGTIMPTMAAAIGWANSTLKGATVPGGSSTSSPAPTPAPSPSPAPTPAPVPTPAPTPAPVPTPAPTPAPVPTPPPVITPAASTIIVNQPASLTVGTVTFTGTVSGTPKKTALAWHTTGNDADGSTDFVAFTPAADGTFSVNLTIDHPDVPSTVWSDVDGVTKAQFTMTPLAHVVTPVPAPTPAPTPAPVPVPVPVPVYTVTQAITDLQAILTKLQSITS